MWILPCGGRTILYTPGVYNIPWPMLDKCKLNPSPFTTVTTNVRISTCSLMTSGDIAAAIWGQGITRQCLIGVGYTPLLPTFASGHVNQMIFFFWDGVSLCSPDCPGTHFVDRLASNSLKSNCLCLLSAGIKGCSTIAQWNFFIQYILILSSFPKLLWDSPLLPPSESIHLVSH